MAYKSLADIIKPQEEEPIMSEMAPTDYENMQSPVAPDMMYSTPKLEDVILPKQEQPEVPMLAEADIQQPSPQAPDTRTDYEKLEAKLQELRGLDAARQETAGKYNFGAKAAAILGDTLARYNTGGIQKSAKAPVQYTGPKLSEAMAMIGEVKAPSTTEQRQTLIDQYKQLALNERAKNKLSSEDARAKRSEDLRRELNKAQIEGSLKEAEIRASAAGKLGKGNELSERKFEYQKQKDQEKSANSRNKVVDEIEGFASNIDNNIKRAKELIDKSGTFELFGPESEILGALMDEIATDMAKLQDPDSVARPSEVQLVRKNLIPDSVMYKIGTRNSTAESLLENFKDRVKERTDTAYKVRGIDRDTKKITPSSSLSEKDQAALDWAKANPDNQDAIEILKLNKK